MAQTVLGLDLHEVSVGGISPKRGGGYLLSEDEAGLGSGHVSPTLCDDTLEKVRNHLNSWIYGFKLHIRMTALKNVSEKLKRCGVTSLRMGGITSPAHWCFTKSYVN